MDLEVAWQSIKCTLKVVIFLLEGRKVLCFENYDFSRRYDDLYS